MEEAPLENSIPYPALYFCQQGNTQSDDARMQDAELDVTEGQQGP